MPRQPALILIVVATIAAFSLGVWWKSSQRAATPLPLREPQAPREVRLPVLATAIDGHEICIYPSGGALPHSEVLSRAFRAESRASSNVTLLDIVLRNTTAEPWTVDGKDLWLEGLSNDSATRLRLEPGPEFPEGMGAPSRVAVPPGGSIRWVRAIPIESNWPSDPQQVSNTPTSTRLTGLGRNHELTASEPSIFELKASEAYLSSLEQWRAGSGVTLNEILVDHPLTKVVR